jgi:HPt (histidine-containing phosphotransfer) domain-containing protein
VAEAGEPVLDESRLKASSMGNAELEAILVRTFVHHIRPRLERLREAGKTGDAGAIEMEAHGIKGMCATIGAMACADVFGRIERLGREKRLEPVAPMIDYAEIEVTRVETLIAPRAKVA